MNLRDIEISTVITKFEGSHPVVSSRCNPKDKESLFEFEKSSWEISVLNKTAGDAIDIKAIFKIIKGSINNSNVALSFEIFN